MRWTKQTPAAPILNLGSTRLVSRCRNSRWCRCCFSSLSSCLMEAKSLCIYTDTHMFEQPLSFLQCMYGIVLHESYVSWNHESSKVIHSVDFKCTLWSRVNAHVHVCHRLTWVWRQLDPSKSWTVSISMHCVVHVWISWQVASVCTGQKPWVSPRLHRENPWVHFYPQTGLLYWWATVQLLIRLGCLSNELMAIKLLKSLT